MPTLTIFTNFRINDEERFLRMKDSFLSFKDIDAVKWVINVRGEYKLKTLFFLQNYLQDRLSPHVIESGKGWFHDSRRLLSEIQTDYVMYWVEDHINMIPVERYNSILKEMRQSNSQFLFTSWWVYDQMENAYEGIKKMDQANIESFIVDKFVAQRINKKCPNHYIISALGIFDTGLFNRLVNTNHPILRRWPRETPFDLEKRVTDTCWLPLKVALPKYELFAPIDDDMGGYPGSLQTRGLYPIRETRTTQYPSSQQGFIRRVSKLIPSPIKSPVTKVIKLYKATHNLIKRIGYHLS